MVMKSYVPHSPLLQFANQCMLETIYVHFTSSTGVTFSTALSTYARGAALVVDGSLVLAVSQAFTGLSFSGGANVYSTGVATYVVYVTTPLPSEISIVAITGFMSISRM